MVQVKDMEEEKEGGDRLNEEEDVGRFSRGREERNTGDSKK